MITDCVNYRELPQRFQKMLEELEEKCSKNSERLYWLNNRCKWFVHHDFYHSERVASNLDAIVSLEREKGELTVYEIFCLFCAAFLHDIGMSGVSETCKQVRKNHGKRSAQMIDDESSLVGEIVRSVGLKQRELEVIKNLCTYHHGKREKLEDIQMEDGTIIHYERIISIIRLADQSDVFIERSPRREREEHYKRMKREAWEELEVNIKYFTSKSKYVGYKWELEIIQENIKSIKESLRELKTNLLKEDQTKLEIFIGDLEEYNEAEKHYKWHESIEKVLFARERSGFLIVLVPRNGVTEDLLEEVKGYISEECTGNFNYWSVKIEKNKTRIKEYEEKDPRIPRGFKEIFVVESREDTERLVRETPNFIRLHGQVTSWEEKKRILSERKTREIFKDFDLKKAKKVTCISGGSGKGKTIYLLLFTEYCIEKGIKIIFIRGGHLAGALKYVKDAEVILAIDDLGGSGDIEETARELAEFACKVGGKLILTLRPSDAQLVMKALLEKFNPEDIEKIDFSLDEEDLQETFNKRIVEWNIDVESKNVEGYLKVVRQKWENMPLWIDHVLGNFKNRKMTMNDLEKFPKGVLNVDIQNIKRHFGKDEALLKVLIAITNTLPTDETSLHFLDFLYQLFGAEKHVENTSLISYLTPLEFEGMKILVYVLGPQSWKESLSQAVQFPGNCMESQFATSVKRLYGEISYERILEELRERIEDNLDNFTPEFWYLLSDLAKQGEHELAYKILRYPFLRTKPYLRTSPEMTYARFVIGQKYFEQAYNFFETKNANSLEKASKLCEKSTNIYPVPETYSNWGNTLGEWAWIIAGREPEKAIEKLQEACKKYEKAIEIDKNYAEVYNNLGTTFFRWAKIIAGREPEKAIEKLQEAITYFDKAIEIKQDLERAWCNKGVVLGELGRLEEAITYFDKAIEIKQDLEEAWYGKGTALSMLGKFEEAIVCFDKAIEIKQDNEITWINKGISLGELGRLEEAITCFDKAIEIKQDNEEAWCDKGITLGELGRFEEAIVCFDKAIEIKQDFEHAWYSKAKILRKLGRFEEAIVCFDKAIEIKQDFERAWYNKGAILSELERWEDAECCYEEILKINPNAVLTLENLSEVLLIRGELVKGLEMAKKALRLAEEPEDKTVSWFLCISAYLFKGEGKKAQEEIERLTNYFRGLGVKLTKWDFSPLLPVIGERLEVENKRKLLSLISLLKGESELEEFERRIKSSTV